MIPGQPLTSGPERRLLVISYHFPPDGAVGGLRWAGLTKYLAPLGWKSWVVTAASSVGAWSPPGVAIESCPPGPTLRDIYRRFRQRLQGQDGTMGTRAPAAEPRRQHPAAGLLATFRLEGAALLWFPDEGRGWILRAAARARSLIARVRPDVIVSSGPPHSAHLATWLATRGKSIRWLLDFRDPWAGPISKGCLSHPSQRSRIARPTIAQLERLVTSAATGIIANTRELTVALSARCPGVPVTWIPNSVDRELLPPRSADRFPGLGIVHLGTLYGGRDLSPVLQAFRVFLDRYPRAAQQGSQLRNAGLMEVGQAEKLQCEINALDLDRHVMVLGVLPRSEALEVLARSRLAVVLAQDQDVEIPAKLFESVAMDIATVVIGAAESAVGREARRLGATVVEPDDIEGMVRVLTELWLNGAPKRSDRGAAAAIDYRDLATHVSRLLGGETSGDTGP